MCAPRVSPALVLTGGDENERTANFLCFLLFPSETAVTQPETQVPVTLKHSEDSAPLGQVWSSQGWVAVTTRLEWPVNDVGQEAVLLLNSVSPLALKLSAQWT